MAHIIPWTVNQEIIYGILLSFDLLRKLSLRYDYEHDIMTLTRSGRSRREKMRSYVVAYFLPDSDS
jgi:hypothetical protein